MPKSQELRLHFFSGFYESIHDSVFDQETEYIMEEYNKKYDDFDFSIDYLAYCKSYVAAISKEIGIKLEFVEMTSPREYNFTTDNIYCKISAKAIEKISSALNSESLKTIIKQRFSSRDGFISFYSNDVEEWKETPISEWDYNELGTLLDAWIIENNDLEYWKNLDFCGYEYCSGNGQYVNFKKLWDEKPNRKKRNCTKKN